MDKQLNTTSIFDYREVCEAIFNFSAEAIIIVNSASFIVHANPTACKLFGYESNELIHEKMDVLIPPKYRKMHNSHVDRYNIKPKARAMAEGMSLSGIKKNGDIFPISASLSPAKIKSEAITIALIIDVTEQTESKNKLRSLNIDLENKVNDRTRELAKLVNQLEAANNDLKTADEEIRQALEVEKQLNELKSRFVSMASHEFRTPLSTILSSTSLLEKYGTEKKFEEKRLKHYQRIKSNVRALTSILNDFLSIDKLQEGKIECHRENMNLKELALEVLEEMEELKKPGQTLMYNHSGQNLTYLDPILIKNCFNNLFSNAIKYSQPDKTISLKTFISETETIIEVTDQGIGIPEEEQNHLFERFFRAKNVTNIQGTGLGLTIVKRYVELMHGSITCTSKHMEGTTFTIRFIH